MTETTKKISEITKEEIEKLYIEQNLVREEVCSKLGISGTSLGRLCRKFGIKKDLRLSAKATEGRNLEKFGVKNTSALPGVRAKIEKTTMERYGVRVSSQSPEIKEKQKQTNLKKYGGVSALQNETVKAKSEDTMMKKYGVKRALQNEEIKERAHQTNLRVHGYDYAILAEGQTKETAEMKSKYSKETLDILYDKDKFEAFLKADPDQTIKYYAQSLKCYPASVASKIRLYGLEDLVGIYPHSSSYETEILNLISSWGIEAQHDVTGLLPNNQEIDIYVPSRHIGIEFNGTYWHSDLYKPKDYHYKKTIAAEAAGIRLIHIYEYEWLDPVLKTKIIELLRIALGCPSRVIYARQCEVREIDDHTAAELNNKVHLQGHRRAQLTYGLYYHDELVQLMSFSQTRYNRNLKNPGEWEIIRGCPGSNNIVVGGVSKLFAHFVRAQHPSKVFSYCDLNKFNGASYEALGMRSIGDTGPNKVWIIDGQGIPRNPSRYKEYKEKAEAIMWGAGSRKFVWEPQAPSNGNQDKEDATRAQ